MLAHITEQMRPVLISLTAIAIFYGCTKKDNLTKLPIDTKGLFVKEIHEYEFYPDGQIKVDRIIKFNYEKGVLTDSSAFDNKQFFYNSKGQIERILDLTNSSQRFKLYDNLDSLILDYTLVEGDTFLVDRFNFKNGKKIERKSLMFAKTKSTQGFDYDTLGSTGEFFYEGQILKKQIEKYITGEVNEIHYIPTLKTGVYNFILIAPKGDTLMITRTIIRGDSQIVIREDIKESLKDTLYYNDRVRWSNKSGHKYDINLCFYGKEKPTS